MTSCSDTQELTSRKTKRTAAAKTTLANAAGDGPTAQLPLLRQVLGCAFFSTKLCLSRVKLCAIFVVIEIVSIARKTRLPKYFRKS